MTYKPGWIGLKSRPMTCRWLLVLGVRRLIGIAPQKGLHGCRGACRLEEGLVWLARRGSITKGVESPRLPYQSPSPRFQCPSQHPALVLAARLLSPRGRCVARRRGSSRRCDVAYLAMSALTPVDERETWQAAILPNRSLSCYRQKQHQHHRCWFRCVQVIRTSSLGKIYPGEGQSMRLFQLCRGNCTHPFLASSHGMSVHSHA